jgi:hypothetical protein
MARVRWLAAICVTTLAACGGGGGGGDPAGTGAGTVPDATVDSNLVADPATGKIALRDSDGDLHKYLGRWESECVPAQSASFNGAQAFVNVYEFKSVEGLTVHGRLTQMQYRDKACTSATDPASVGVDVTLQRKGVETIAGVSAGPYAGTADAVDVNFAFVKGRPDDPQFIGFSSGFKRLVMSTSLRGFASLGSIVTSYTRKS